MTTLAQITMNAGDDIPGSTIKWNLKNNADKFDLVYVVDGNMTDEAWEFYKQFPNVMAISSPWEDSYVKQYQTFADKLIKGEWCLYLDCDEIPSEELMLQFKFGMKWGKVTMVQIPCILHLTEDGKKYYPVEPQPPQDKKETTWTKNIWFKKTDGLHFRHFGSHVIPQQSDGVTVYAHYPYYHMKSLESFVYNDVYQAFLHPEGQGYDPVEAAQFKMFTKQYKTLNEFKKATKEGAWPIPLQKFARSKATIYNRPISRLAWVYYILEGHQNPWSDWQQPSWDDVKKHVLGKESMELFEKNKNEENFIEIIR